MFRLGLTQWNHSAWPSQIGGAGLERYAAQFNTVEGNTTFYALPSRSTAASWAAQVGRQFRFCFKFPKQVTHDKQLFRCTDEMRAYWHALEPLLPVCGPFMIQLPPSFDASNIKLLEGFLSQLPSDLQYGIEFRHSSFFDRGCGEKSTNQLLSQLNIERIWFDTRALMSRKTVNLETLDAQGKKPDFPVYGYAITDHPMVRLISHTHWDSSFSTAEQWGDRFSAWISEGRDVYCFAHTPNNAQAPQYAAAIHKQIEQQTDIDPWQWHAGSQSTFL